MRELRRAIPVDRRIAAAKAVAAVGLDFLGLAPASVISGYYPVRNEFDVMPLMARLAREGHSLCLPVIGDARSLSFAPWAPDAPLKAGPFGIPMPAGGGETEPDVILAPLLAFDLTGRRLGYGAGYYDGTLAGLRAKRRIVAIGVAFDEQRVEAVPSEPHDQRLDWLLTQAGPYRCPDGA